MVVDTSAIMALLLGEPEATQIDNLLSTTDQSVISAANHVELLMVVESRAGAEGVLLADEALRRLEIGIEDVTAEVARLAVDGWRRFGKGRHPAGLNFGDCFAYGLALARNESLLFVGQDFAQTDIRSALDL